MEYQFASQRGQPPREAAIIDQSKGILVFTIPVEQPNPPGIKARLRVEARTWNDWHGK